MQDQTKPSTILLVAIAVSALMGAIGGGIVATFITGTSQGSALFGQALLNDTDLSEQQVERNIIELVEEESATIAVVERVTPAVVSVVIEKRRQDLAGGDVEFSDPFFFPLEPMTAEEGNQLIEIGGGTGFFVSSDGYIVTNRHVVSDESAVFTVVTSDGAELPAELVAVDVFLDIAVLKVEGDTFPVAELADSDTLRIGQTVIAIGNTLSEFRNTVTKGVISGINRRVVAGDAFGSSDVIDSAIQTDAAINPGNSGGPLINLFGEVVGVNTAVSFEGQSIGFAIPINDITKIINDVQTYGRIVRPWLGVRYVVLTPQIAKEEGLAYDHGAYIVSGAFEEEDAVFEDSPADKAGIRGGDIILSMDGTPMSDEFSLTHAISQLLPGDTVTLQIARDDEVMTIEVVLEELDPDRF